jgi:hypothetical protein
MPTKTSKTKGKNKAEKKGKEKVEKNDKDKECPVCLTEQKRNKTFHCSHKLCLGCLAKMESFACPMCRADFKQDLTSIQKKKIELVVQKKQQNNIAADAALARRLQNQQVQVPMTLIVAPQYQQEIASHLARIGWNLRGQRPGVYHVITLFRAANTN